MGWLALNIFRKKHIVYGADDWVQASESMFRWPEKKNTLFYRAYASLNKYMEKVVVSSALFGVAAGGQLIEKYNVYGCQTYPTSPRMTLSRSDIFERENTCEGEKITFINVGSLIHDKAQHVLLEAFSLCCQNHENLELNIVGDGPERMNLELLSEKLGIANKVHFLGYIEEESTLYGYLRNADVFALSSVTEGFPRVLYEAMAMRLPIVTTDVGGIPFLLSNKENALLVKPGNPSQLSESLNVVIEDNNLRKKMIRIASQTIEEVFTRMDGSQISKLLLKHNAIS
jgi:glycosyltransferase involved in cell wall biosynthesis